MENSTVLMQNNITVAAKCNIRHEVCYLELLKVVSAFNFNFLFEWTEHSYISFSVFLPLLLQTAVQILLCNGTDTMHENESCNMGV